MDWRFSTFLLTLFGLLIAFTWATSDAGLCSSAYVKGVLADHTKDGALNCFEFWFNRYQTLAAAMIAFTTTAIALRPALAQLREMRRQSLQKSYDTLRERLEEIEATKEYYWNMTGKIYLVYGVSFGLTALNDDGSISETNFEEFAEAVRAYTEACENLPARLGPAWGDENTREARRNLIHALTVFSFDAFEVSGQARRNLDRHRTRHVAEVYPPDIRKRIEEFREGLNEFKSAGAHFFQALEEEEERVNRLLASLESHVLT